MWEKIVLNLLSNAFKFTFEGGITVSLRRVDGAIELDVRDTGIGIPAAELPHVFERFRRVEGSRSRTHEGTGIGLALVQELVRLHGGHVRVESFDGQGSTFTVAIPAGHAHLPAERIGAPTALVPTRIAPDMFLEEALRWLPDETPAGGPRRPRDAGDARPWILVADDNGDMREYLRRLLSERYEVTAVVDGAAALAAASERVPDLVLTDVMMPRVGGYELLRALRAEARTREVPVILLSARAGEESRIDGLEAGADDYLIKPFSAKELLARVHAHLDLARQRRAAREALRKSEDELADFFESAPVGLHWVGPDGTILRANQAELDLLGYRRDEYVGRHIAEFHADRDVIDGILQRLSADETVHDHEARLRCKDGSIKHVLIDASVRWEDGRFVHTRCVTRDITDRKRAEVTLRESQERLASELEATTRLHALSTRLMSADDLTTALEDVLDNAIATCRADFGNIQLLNAHTGALEIVVQRGFRQDFLEYFRTVRVDDGSASAQAMQRGERIIIEDVNLDPAFEPHRAIAASAGFHAVQSTPLTTHDGRILGMLSTHFRAPWRVPDRDQRFLDLYARHAADLIERLRLEHELKEADRRKDEFLATLSHELRTPLNAMLGWTRMLCLGALDASATQRALDVIDRNVNHQHRLITDLLDISRIISGKLTLEKSVTDLTAIVATAVETVQPTAQAKSLTLSVGLPSRPVRVDGDADRLRQVVANLVSNAVKFTPSGGRVDVDRTVRERRVRLTVADTGRGISPAFLPHIFERFRQANASSTRTEAGLGLGLAIARHIVELHDGTIRGESAGEGHGATFTMELPVAAVLETSAPMLVARNGESVSGPPRTLHDVRVLIVDDDADSRDVFRAVLVQAGAEVTAVENVRAALQAARVTPPDVIMCDLAMPGDDGFALIRELRSWPSDRGGTVPTIAVTAYARPEDRALALDAGFDQHVAKPVEPRGLLDVVAQLVVDGRARQHDPLQGRLEREKRLS
jgi:PAS domain S-box-containing protein